jgi:hypothetical protein
MGLLPVIFMVLISLGMAWVGVVIPLPWQGHLVAVLPLAWLLAGLLTGQSGRTLPRRPSA